jgi:hypothetical protein
LAFHHLFSKDVCTRLGCDPGLFKLKTFRLLPVPKSHLN